MTNSTDNELGFPPEIIRFIGKKWVVPIFKEFESNQQVRFSEFKQKFKITSKVLSEILGEMKDLGFIDKQEKKLFPPTVTYTLSNRGLDLLDVIDKLEKFSRDTPIENKTEVGDDKYLIKFAIMLAIEKSILKMGEPELKKVKERLSDLNCTLDDCIYNPTPLKKVLCELFGNCYEDIYRGIYNSLKDVDADEEITKFLHTMKV
jgi:DNA-binding HxlR family transcriptional regulator